MKIKFLTFILSVFILIDVQAQDNTAKKWTLEECINYAIEHNIDIQQRKLQKESAEIDLNTAKMSRLPDLNAGVGQNWSFGRTNNNLLGVYEDKTISNSSFSIQSSTPIFTGFRINNEISRNKFELEAAIQNLSKAKEDLSLNIASLFLQVLFNREILKVSDEQLALSQSQIKRTESLVEVGKVPTSQLYDIKAQVAKDEVSVVQAKNNLELSLLDLAQSLELERSSNFDILIPDVQDVMEENMKSLLPPEVIYNNAITFKPQIKEQEFKLESTKKSLKIAESGYLPKLNLNFRYDNSYFYDYKSNANNVSLSDQLRNNGGEGIGLSLSIPIFNRFAVRNQVKGARLNIQNQQLTLDNTKKTLYKEIQTAYLNATTAQEKYLSTIKAVDASQEAFKYAQERYEIGKSTVFEFNEARTKLIQSLSDQIQAKYDYIFRAKILDFYNGIQIIL